MLLQLSSDKSNMSGSDVWRFIQIVTNTQVFHEYNYYRYRESLTQISCTGRMFDELDHAGACDERRAYTLVLYQRSGVI